MYSLFDPFALITTTLACLCDLADSQLETYKRNQAEAEIP